MNLRASLGLGAIIVIALFWWASRPDPIHVQLATVEKGVVERIVVNTRAGTVKACDRARLSLPIGGQVEKLFVTEGSKVQQGDPLLELWNKDRKAQVQQAKAAFESTHLEHDRTCITAANDRKEADRTQRLVKKQLVSEEQADNMAARADASESACKAAEAREQQAKATVEFAQAVLEQTILRAPFTGVVAEVTGEVGEFTTPSPPGVATPPAIDLMSDDCHYVEAPIDEVDAANLQQGQPVRIRIDAVAGKAFPGKLRRIAPYVRDFEKQARTVDVEVDFLELGEEQLLAGYSADVEVVLEQRMNVLRIPAEALMEEMAEAGLVFSVMHYEEGEPLSKVPVKIGLRNWQFVEILSGLKDGDNIVTSVGLPGVVEGAQVVGK
ncbi:MAG: efflux RND transporter periplasmic adaptor subunit [Cellvibrionaceae bacterium]